MNIQFFRMAAAAAFANPFSEKRVEIDRQILGAPEDAQWDQLLAPLFESLEQEIEKLNVNGLDVRQRYNDSDTQAVAVSILFYVYTKAQCDFDGLIEKQIAKGDDSCEAPFAKERLDELKEFGFSHEEAARYIGIFYQIRRAYYFISKGLAGSCPSMKKLRAQLWENIFTHDISLYERLLWNRMEDFSTLLLGETGTGKGAAAAAIGRSGYIPFNPKTATFAESFTRAFISINLSQYPETLIESELFGHRKGAFTGAMEKHDGIFARCSPYGAIFLDEIGDVPVPIQIKLLQVLQERTFSPVGSHEQHRFEGRVIAATNKSIERLRKEGAFRDDFYYRLCSDLITVPPLRTRIQESPEELDLLAGHLLQRIYESERMEPVAQKLRECVGKNYPWPGNVRELEQAIRRILLTGKYEGNRFSVREPELHDAVRFGSLTAKELIQKYCSDLYEMYGNYGEVARRTGLDWRTVKKHLDTAT